MLTSAIRKLRERWHRRRDREERLNAAAAAASRWRDSLPPPYEPCRHDDAMPLATFTGKVVAWLCLDCEQEFRMPADWDKPD